MEYRRLGASGLKVSAVGLGCNNFGRQLDAKQSAQIVHAALDAGVIFFDTADTYGGGLSEEFLGKALRSRQEDVVVATKFGVPATSDSRDAALVPAERLRIDFGPNDRGASRRYVMRAVDRSLRRLDREAIDLYQMHWPDPGTPLEETLGALDDLVRVGKIRYIGCSNFSGWQVADADWIARNAAGARFISAQNRYNLLERDVERDVIPACAHFGLGFIPYYPLADGLLTGKYIRDAPPPTGSRLADPKRGPRYLNSDNFDRVEHLSSLAINHGLSLLQLAILGLSLQPAVASVVTGATSPEQVLANANAVAAEVDTSRLLMAIDEVVPNCRPPASPL